MLYYDVYLYLLNDVVLYTLLTVHPVLLLYYCTVPSVPCYTCEKDLCDFIALRVNKELNHLTRTIVVYIVSDRKSSNTPDVSKAQLSLG